MGYSARICLCCSMECK